MLQRFSLVILLVGLGACGQPSAGPKGAPGPQGPPGAKGDKGDKGDNGEPGSAAAGIRIEQREGCGLTCRVSCRADEEMVSAFCYRQGSTAGAVNNVSYQRADGGFMTASCSTGGPHIRALCIKR
jgi:hypothetical protein